MKKNCPYCQRLVTVYRRLIGKSISTSLINLYALTVKNKDRLYFHFTEFTSRNEPSLDYANAKYWGLIASMPNNNEKQRTSGQWYLTDKGHLFVRGEITLPKYVFIELGVKKGESEEQVSISDTLKAKFNYQEIFKKEEYLCEINLAIN